LVVRCVLGLRIRVVTDPARARSGSRECGGVCPVDKLAPPQVEAADIDGERDRSHQDDEHERDKDRNSTVLPAVRRGRSQTSHRNEAWMTGRITMSGNKGIRTMTPPLGRRDVSYVTVTLDPMLFGVHGVVVLDPGETWISLCGLDGTEPLAAAITRCWVAETD
jgi:hypothetical protein